MDIAIGVIMFVMGAVMGSFACCQVWRLKFREHGEKLGGRSVCLECEKKLRWYELIPVVSWVMQKGRCRKCKKFIGWQEILCEVGMGALFVFSYFFWPERMGGASETAWNWVGFLGFLAMLVGLCMLFVYDYRWGKLPTVVLIYCVVCAVVTVAAALIGGFLVTSWWSFAGGLVILPGIYYVLYKMSKEQWVGAGDWILALALSIVLADVVLALLCLLVANVAGCLVALPVMMKSKKSAKGLRLAMGPLLIIGFLVVFFAADSLRLALGI